MRHGAFSGTEEFAASIEAGTWKTGTWTPRSSVGSAARVLQQATLVRGLLPALEQRFLSRGPMFLVSEAGRALKTA